MLDQMSVKQGKPSFTKMIHDTLAVGPVKGYDERCNELFKIVNPISVLIGAI